MAGLFHIYCGDGKGKTTAAAGLAVRAAGAGMRVVFAQFLKDGTSSELKILRGISNIEVLVCPKNYGFFKNMSEDVIREAAQAYGKLFSLAVKKADSADMLIFDEAVSAVNHGLIPEDDVIEYIKSRPPGLELVLTGRNPSARLLALSDYATEMRKIKHPYDSGVAARRGVEY
ncbi:MAG: cob(I)yrinic acid a,c-diamide adenosyltransferase [Clostridia bacterium]|nr:cob(I)yrinic acid a,c-diamide adenosyltransferase [Clostridia bacterium]